MSDATPSDATPALPAAPAGSPESENARRKEIRLVYLGLMVVMALAALDQSIVATALPRIVSDLGGVQEISWVVTAYVLASTVTMPLYGKLSDQFGRKPLIYVAVLIFLLGSILSGLSQSMFELIVFRAIQGFGAGGLLPLTQITIGDLIPPRERGKYQGNMAIVFAIANVSGPALGGVITQTLSWHWIFYINLPIGALALVMIGIALKRPNVLVSRSIDYAGAAILTVSATAFLLVMSLGGTEFPWVSAQSAGLCLMAVLFGCAFVVRERTAAAPLLPLSLFKNKTFMVGSTIVALIFMSTQGANIFYPLFFQVVNGVPAAKSGLLTVPLPLGMLLAARINGHIMMATGRYKPAQTFGLTLSVIAFSLLTYATASGQSFWVIEPTMFILGLSMGFVMPNMTVAVQNAAEPGTMGVAIATMTFFRSLGGVLGVATAGLVLIHSLQGQIASTVLPAGTNAQTYLDGGVIQINALAPAAHALAVAFYRQAIASSFSTGIIAAALALFFLIFMPEIELRSGAHARGGRAGRPSGAATSGAAPADADAPEHATAGTLAE